MFSYLPIKLQKFLKELISNNENINEIRIRENCCPLIITKRNKFLLKNITINKSDIDNIISLVCNYSIYSFDEQIKNGYITTKKGERIGLCGEFVYEKGEIITIKNFTSLCIRIPNEHNDFASDFVNKIYSGGSVLVFSKTGVGKTTFLRDFAKQIIKKYNKNVVIIDERNEIASTSGVNTFNLFGVDVLTYCDKSFGFNQAVRSLNPEVIITDELITKSDFYGVVSGVLSGIDVIASVHAEDLTLLQKKELFSGYKIQDYFNFFINIKNVNGDRVLSVFDKGFNKICL